MKKRTKKRTEYRTSKRKKERNKTKRTRACGLDKELLSKRTGKGKERHGRIG